MVLGLTVTKTKSGVQHFSTELWSVLTAEDKRAFLPEE